MQLPPTRRRVLATALAVLVGGAVAHEAGVLLQGLSGTVTVPLAWFYRPPVDGTAADLALTTSRFVLTRGDEAFRDELRSQGARGPILLYVRADAVLDDTGLTYTFLNNVGYQDGDWERISSEHPDWFALDAAGKRILADPPGGGDLPFYVMDPGSEGWRRFFLERLQAMAEGWDGVFLDNVEASLRKRERLGEVPAAYPTDDTWAAVVREFTAFVRSEYAEPTGLPVEANVIETRTALSSAYEQLLPELDGVMLEGWLDGEDLDWEGRVADAELAQERGLHAMLTTNGAADDERERTFALASFLLADQGRTSFRYTSYESYDRRRDLDPYRLDLGEPTGPRVREGRAWRRAYERGTVTVHPDERRGEISSD